MAELLDETSIEKELRTVPEWQVEGSELVRSFGFPYYLAGITFVGEVAHLAESANHHPDMLVGWRKVTVRLMTHSKGGLTAMDFALAREINGLFK